MEKNSEKIRKMEQSDPKYCFQVQLELEGLQTVKGDRIVKVPVDHFDVERREDAEPPKIIAVDFCGEINIFYSILMPEDLVADLEKLDSQSFIKEQEKIADILKRNNQSAEISGLHAAYTFPGNVNVDLDNTKIFSGNDEAVRKFDPTFFGRCPTVYAAMQNGEIAACCVSSRESDKAGEAWIFTLPKYRKQGFGLKAVQLWASELQKQGKIPFYTHKADNIASQKLAEKLNLAKVFESVSYE